MSKKEERLARAAAVKEEISKSRTYAWNKKQQLKENGGWSVLPNAVYKTVLPRIINEACDKAFAGAKRRPDVTDIAFLYGILLSYANTDPQNEYEGAAWVSYENLAQLMRISRNRIAPLCRILEANGLVRTVIFYEGTKKRKLYYPIHITEVSEDNYVIGEDGKKIIPSLDVYRDLVKNAKRGHENDI